MSRHILYIIILCTIAALHPGLATSPARAAAPPKGLALANTGTDRVYFTHNGKPLLSFGTFSDFIFYAAEDAYDYKQWADWAAAHGMNHARAYLPGSWTHIESFAKDNGGSPDNLLFPYMETAPGSRQFDLTRFNPAWWRQFREQCEYLESRGIIIDLLMFNGWQLWTYNPEIKTRNWGGHFFNPKNNVNAFTDHLGDDSRSENTRLQFYHSVADGRTELFNVQKAYFEKIIETTHDLDNMYYELVHELAQNYTDWHKTSQWLEHIALAVRDKWAELEPGRPIILGTDAGHLVGFPFSQGGGFPEPGSEIDWVFSRPYFDVLIWGNAHYVANAREWRRKYKKPYIPQESFDDSTEKWSYRHPEMRVHIRKYFWKFMMAKVQQMDLYMKSRPGYPDLSGAHPHNYNPNGWNPVENDARVLRQFFNSLTNFGSLDFQGHVSNGPTGHHLVLSSPEEAIIYFSSPTSVENRQYESRSVRIQHLALPDGEYTADIWNPAEGLMETRMMRVQNHGDTRGRLPAYTDDIAIHLHR